MRRRSDKEMMLVVFLVPVLVGVVGERERERMMMISLSHVHVRE